MNTDECTVERCEASPLCAQCGQRKAPRGRSVPLVTAGSYCHPMSCSAYMTGEPPGHLFPGELAELQGPPPAHGGREQDG